MHDPTKSRYRYLSFIASKDYRRYKREDDSKRIEDFKLEGTDQDIPAHGTYNELLFKPEWKEKRKLILQRDGHSCVICHKNESLNVHHRQYHFIVRKNKFSDPWEYSNNLLITLCESCHKRGHSKFKVPIINL